MAPISLHHEPGPGERGALLIGEVVVLIHARGRGRGSGVEIDNHIAWVWTFRGGQATRLVVYEEQSDALAAVGLR